MKLILKYHWVIAILLYTGSALYITHPLIFNLGTLITGYGDELLIAWIHNWVFNALLSNPLDIFNANIYFPHENSLAYSDFFLISTIFGIVPFLLFNEPITFVNFTIISSLIFLGMSVYYLAFYFTKSFLPSFIAGLLVVFSPAVLDKFVHIQILAIYFVPLALLFGYLFIDTRKTRYLFLCMGCFVLQTLNSFLPGYFIAFSISILLSIYYLYNRKKVLQLATVKNCLIIIFSICLIIPAMLPYFSVSHEFNFVRDIRETIHLALQPEDYLYTNQNSRLEALLSSIQPKSNYPDADFKPGFLGGAFTLLVLISMFFIIKTFSKKDWKVNSIFFIAIFGFIMSLGPFLHLFRNTIHYPFPIPLPYAVFYYIIPGFQGIRNSARWEMLFIIAIAIVIAIVLHKLLRKVNFKSKLIVYALLIVFIVAEFNFPIKYQQVTQKKDFPEVYDWIQTTPSESIIIEMPIYTWDMQPYVMDENMREYYSTLHFRKMVNGASGFSPPPWQSNVRNILTYFPEDKIVRQLSDMGVTHIIVHSNEYDILYKDKFKVNNKTVMNGSNVIKLLNKNKSLKLVKQIEGDYVYQIK